MSSEMGLIVCILWYVIKLIALSDQTFLRGKIVGNRKKKNLIYFCLIYQALHEDLKLCVGLYIFSVSENTAFWHVLILWYHWHLIIGSFMDTTVTICNASVTFFHSKLNLLFIKLKITLKKEKKLAYNFG